MKKPDETRAAYDASVADVRELLKRIEYVVNESDYADKMNGLNWGHVGSMDNYKHLLKETLMAMCLTPDTDEDVFMAELENELKANRKK